MLLRVLRAIPIVIATAYCFSWGQTPSESRTGIDGVITIGPIRPGPPSLTFPSSRPLANATFIVESEKGIVTSFTTDNQGHFRISLAPGHYTISMSDKRGRIARCGPFDVDVVAGQMTKVEWQCDTGMR